jgi:L-aspartate oxidase
MRRMRETGAEHVWLDARHFGAEKWERRFPTILATCRSHGVDPVTDLIPVAPACHYASGGVATDLDGCSSVPGLFACGEVACSGVHGANRLASNSLLEGLVFSQRIADRLAVDLPSHRDPAPDRRRAGLVPAAALPRVQRVMTERAGVLRSREGLDDAERRLADIAAEPAGSPDTESWETTNLLTVGAALVEAARLREETRGSHWREDFPDRDDDRWRGHVDATLTDGGILHAEYHPSDRTATTGARP